MNIFLIGYRCTGKTSVGSTLADRIGWGFFDTDTELVKEAGKSIKEIVASGGWELFRNMEQAVIKRVCSLDSRVVATGGGAVLNVKNVKRMKHSGIVVWLCASAETIKDRIQKDRSTDDFRPALTQKGAIEEIQETLLERHSHYQKAMGFVIHTDNISVDVVCNSVIAELETRDIVI